jgi:hypothetical protein
VNWLRHWFAGRQSKLAPAVFRPRLEPLEDRRLMNVSSVFDSLGRRVTFTVDKSNTLTRYDRTGAHVITHNVLRAHGYHDITGGIGLIIVFSDFTAVDVNHSGSHNLGSHIVDAAKAFDSRGRFVFDITFTSGPNFQTIELTNTGSHTISFPGIIAVLIHPYQDRQGKIGREMSLFDTVTTCTLMQVDSNGSHTLAHDAVADAAIKPGDFVIDICTISNQWTQITKNGSHVLGTTYPI